MSRNHSFWRRLVCLEHDLEAIWIWFLRWRPASGIWRVPNPQTTQSHKPVQFKQTCLSSLIIHGSKWWVMCQSFVYDTEKPAEFQVPRFNFVSFLKSLFLSTRKLCSKKQHVAVYLTLSSHATAILPEKNDGIKLCALFGALAKGFQFGISNRGFGKSSFLRF